MLCHDAAEKIWMFEKILAHVASSWYNMSVQLDISYPIHSIGVNCDL